MTLSLYFEAFWRRASEVERSASITFMKYICAPLVLGFLTTACAGPATNLAERVTGTWTQVAHQGSETHYVTAIYDRTGGFVISTSGMDFTNSMAGTWRIQDKVMLLTVTNATQGNFRYVGQVLSVELTA
jgi:hypothetical protein